MLASLDQNQARLFVYKTFVERCRPPSLDETAGAFRLNRKQALEAFQGLERSPVLVLHPESREVTTALPAAYTLQIGGSLWWAN